MKLSIVTSIYHSAPYLNEFCERSRKAAQAVTGNDYEIILVNDGCPDDSLGAALAQREKDKHIAIVDLSRNFGHHKALMTGLMHARGDRVFLIDCDLEEPPEILREWWSRLDANADLDVVYGVQPSRKGGWFKQLSGNIFYKLANMVSPVEFPRNATVARLMTGRYIQALLAHRDQELYLFGLMAFAGFRQEAAQVVKKDKGSSTYTLFRRFALFLNAMTSFSNYPLYAIFYLGTVISALSFGYIAFLVIRWLLFSGNTVAGWTSLAVSIWAVGGFVLTAIGVLGIYLAKIFNETKPRPFTVVRRIYRDED